MEKVLLFRRQGKETSLFLTQVLTSKHRVIRFARDLDLVQYSELMRGGGGRGCKIEEAICISSMGHLGFVLLRGDCDFALPRLFSCLCWRFACPLGSSLSLMLLAGRYPLWSSCYFCSHILFQDLSHMHLHLGSYQGATVVIRPVALEALVHIK